MGKTYVFLAGGIGNQMFQYAAARAFALRNNSELLIDSWSGFVRDRQYRRKYELHALPIRGRLARALERLPIWVFSAQNKLYGSATDIVQDRLYGKFLLDVLVNNYRCFLPQINQTDCTSNTYFIGYWQSPLYFQDFSEQIKQDLMPPAPSNKLFLDLGYKIRETNSVALGIRLYEETTTPKSYTKDGKLKAISDINSAIARLNAEVSNPQFFIFCTHRSPVLHELNVPDNAIYVTENDGYIGVVENLWLLTQCRHHILTNSTFYWWGAWLSERLYGSSNFGQHILAADNFRNRDGLCENWERF